jgi:hypothetical protein
MNFMRSILLALPILCVSAGLACAENEFGAPTELVVLPAQLELRGPRAMQFVHESRIKMSQMLSPTPTLCPVSRVKGFRP